MSDDDRATFTEIGPELFRLDGRPCEVPAARLRMWMVSGLLGDLEPQRSANGRWSVRRSKIPLLRQIVPRLIEDAEDAMRHRPRRQAAEVSA